MLINHLLMRYNQIKTLCIDDNNVLIKTNSNSSFNGYQNLERLCFRGTRIDVVMAVHELFKSSKN